MLPIRETRVTHRSRLSPRVWSGRYPYLTRTNSRFQKESQESQASHSVSLWISLIGHYGLHYSVYRNSLAQRAPSPGYEIVGVLHKFKLLIAIQRPTLQTGPSKDSEIFHDTWNLSSTLLKHSSGIIHSCSTDWHPLCSDTVLEPGLWDRQEG